MARIAKIRSSNFLKPKPLEAGQKIGIIAPGSAMSEDRFAAGLAEIKRRGFEALCPLDPTKGLGKNAFTSASPEARAQAIMDLVSNPEVGLILAARGGYGSAELLTLLDFEKIRESRKLFMGYSDVTVLLVALASQAGLASVHGATLSAELARAQSDTEARLSSDLAFDLAQGKKHKKPLHCLVARELQFGTTKVSGRLIVGNLTMLISLLGTPWDLSFDQAILVIEDVNEAPYRVHRNLLHLKQAGKLAQLSGLVFGRFSHNNTTNVSGQCTVDEMIKQSVDELFAGTKFPILYGLPVGHDGKNLPLAFGSKAQIKPEGMLVTKDTAVEA
ncbi:LD-carboxypeptidase [bacterium]|nr:LD-carboxypeptidase [bacterium]